MHLQSDRHNCGQLTEIPLNCFYFYFYSLSESFRTVQCLVVNFSLFQGLELLPFSVFWRLLVSPRVLCSVSWSHLKVQFFFSRYFHNFLGLFRVFLDCLFLSTFGNQGKLIWCFWCVWCCWTRRYVCVVVNISMHGVENLAQVGNLDKYVLQFGQIHLAIWTNKSWLIDVVDA